MCQGTMVVSHVCGCKPCDLKSGVVVLRRPSLSCEEAIIDGGCMVVSICLYINH